MEECYWVLVKDVADGNPQNCGTVIVLVKGNRADCLHVVSPLSYRIQEGRRVLER